MTKGFTIWFTGLSGAGKTTLAIAVHQLLHDRGYRDMEILDGDVIRNNISKGLGFSKEDRDTNIRRVGWICQLLNNHDTIVLASVISPYRDIRDEIRQGLRRFVEVYVKCPLEVLIERDVKGLYKKAISGEIKHFTGVSDPYEEPLNPEVIVPTDSETVDESVQKIVTKLENLGYLARYKDGGGI